MRKSDRARNAMMATQSATRLTCLLVLCGLCSTVWSGTIIYPRRVTTVLVKTGESFDIWYDADRGETVNSVELRGPYNPLNPSITIVAGSWEYDEDSQNTYDMRITVEVPTHAPMDRYDLAIKTTLGDEITFGGVKVIQEYRDSYYVMHISDTHRWHKYPGQIDVYDETKQFSGHAEP